MITNYDDRNQIQTPEREPRKDSPEPPVPRKPRDEPVQNNVHEVFKKNPSLDFKSTTLGAGFHGGRTGRRGAKLVGWSYMAALVDALILVAVTCLFVILFSWIAKSIFGSAMGSIIQIKMGKNNGISFFAEIYFLMVWIYLIGTRSAMGFTVGEWAFDLRLGQPHQKLTSKYVWRVLLRSTLVLATGVVVLPALSMLFRVDVPGFITGLRLFSLK
jgi:hypothetical protein